jgi:putative Holliday junction resolvase
LRTLAIDFGERRIGLAISDEEGRLALPLSTLERRDDLAAARAITEIARREGAGELVVGEPRRLDGTAGDAAARARRFAARLAEESGLPCRLVDEALSSDEARRRLAAGGAGRRSAGRRSAGRRSAARLDALAAQVLLEDYLAGRAGVPGGGR